jgi:L-alanine-DL-glutamate epimerase-like enolase superfamily enzyme
MIETVRARAGDSVSFYVDANHAYDAVAALKAMLSWEKHNVAWVEEPSPAADFRGRAMIAQKSVLPMMGDESCKTLAAVTSEVARGSCRMISLKTGGTGYRLSGKILDLCEAFGVIAVSGSQSDSDLGAVAGAHFNAAHRLLAARPAELCSFLDAESGLLAETVVVKDGSFELGNSPGIGVTIDEDKLRRFRVD